MAKESGVSPNVRIMPGSDAISLELDIKGMTEPNKHIEVSDHDQSHENPTDVSSVPCKNVNG